MLDELGHDRDMSVKLNLTGHINDDEILLAHLLQRIRDEVEVFHEEFEAVDQASVGTQVQFFHDILEGDEILDVQIRLVGEVLCGLVRMLLAWTESSLPGDEGTHRIQVDVET
jgi:hypothetical protein